MTNMRGYSKPNRLFVQHLSCSTASDTSTVLPTGMLCDQCLASTWTVGEYLANSVGETSYVFIIKLSTANSGLSTSYFSLCRVSFAFTLSPLKCIALNKKTLPLVALARAAPPQHHGRQRGVLARAPRKSRVSCGKKDEMVEVGAR